jgi:hypothetical protein
VGRRCEKARLVVVGPAAYEIGGTSWVSCMNVWVGMWGGGQVDQLGQIHMSGWV